MPSLSITLLSKMTRNWSDFIWKFSDSHFGIQLPSGSWVAKNKALEKQLKKERLWLLSKEDSILHFRIRFWPRRPHDVPDPQGLFFKFRWNFSEISVSSNVSYNQYHHLTFQDKPTIFIGIHWCNISAYNSRCISP